MQLKASLKAVDGDQLLEKVGGAATPMADLADMRSEYPILDVVCQFISDKGSSLSPDGLHAARGWLQMVDWLIQIGEEEPEYDVFLSYAHADKELAQDIRRAIVKKGCTCFMAEKDIPVATEWEREIHAALSSCSIFLVLITPNSKDRAWILLESGGAWALSKRVVPAVAYVTPSELPEPLRKFQTRSVQTRSEITVLVREIVAACTHERSGARLQ